MLNKLLRAGDPTTLTIAADARLNQTDYVNDQIWEISVGRGEPAAINLQTTYGLRARGLRIFPRFGEGDQSFSDPDFFASPIKLEYHYPNAIQLVFSPLVEISAHLTCWIPQSHAAAGQITLSNTGKMTHRIQLEWVALLNPGEFGERMRVEEIDAVHVLAGATQSLYPVFFVTGGMGTGSGSFPSLNLTFDLAPGDNQTFLFAIAALGDTRASFDLARQVTASNWAAELARFGILDQGLLDIRTGEASWDLALARSQRIALGLISSSTGNLPAPSFVLTRHPDQGYSLKANGSDYNYLWNGQSVMDSLYLAELLLPTHAELMEGVLKNFLAVQNENGTIDLKPGMGGQRAHLNAMPLLASLAWKIFQNTGNIDYLEQILEPLINFFNSWFTPPRDRDQDGIPEWSQFSQTGLDDHPLFAHWHSGAQGVDPVSVECPDLSAYLYQEFISLQKIAHTLKRDEMVETLKPAAETLKTAVQTSWNDSDRSFHYWDRDTHLTPSATFHLCLHWPELPELPIQFYRPLRLLVRVRSSNSSKRRLQMYLHGSGPGGGHLVEPLTENSFYWQDGHAQATSHRIYTSLDHLEIQGLESGDVLEIQSVVLSEIDISLLLPMWAGIATPDQAAKLVKHTITNPDRFWKTFGLPNIATASNQSNKIHSKVNLPLNVMVAEGMLRYGFRGEAAELVSRLMQVTAETYLREGAFRSAYDSERGTGIGERNALPGLPPVNLFLQTLGVEIVKPDEVLLSGFNPYPWPVTVKYRGTTILCQKDKTTIIFPDGQTTTISEPGTHRVIMDRSRSTGNI